jgi:hypothetical protein
MKKRKLSEKDSGPDITRKNRNVENLPSFLSSSSTQLLQRKKNKRQIILSTPTLNIVSATTTSTTANHEDDNDNDKEKNSGKFNKFLVPSEQATDDYDDLLAECLEEMESSIFSQPQPSLITTVSASTSTSSPITTVSEQNQPKHISNANTKNVADNNNNSSDLLWFVPTSTDADKNNQNSSSSSKLKQFNHQQPKQKHKDSKNKLLIEKILTWNQDMLYYSSINSSNKKKKSSTQQHYTRTYNNGFFVPSFDVEMTRHFQIESLSKFILESVSSKSSSGGTSNQAGQLRIPTFERWYVNQIIDWIYTWTLPICLTFFVIFSNIQAT